MLQQNVKIKIQKCIIYLIQMVANKLIILVLVGLVSVLADKCPIAQYWQFYTKQIDRPFDVIKNPYKDPSSQYLGKVKENLSNKDRVCGLKYLDQEKHNYSLQTFENKQLALDSGYIVTHQGICGKCSTTKDLYVYLTTDLTRPVRKCGLKYFYSHQKLKRCIKNLGFTDACTEVWYWNTLNTKKHCLEKCLWSYITKEKFVINGQLNACLQCDEDISGPIFKYESGRTRRNSGIHSEIDRPDDQVYKMDQCYY